MPSINVVQEQVKFTASALLELWELDGRNIGMDTVYNFYDGTNNNFQPLTYNGIAYLPFPIKIENMSQDGKGTLPRPKITVSNIRGFISNILLEYDNLIGATITRTRVFARFVDASNFTSPPPVWSTPDPDAHYPPEPFVINRKVAENRQVVTFELSSPLELEKITVPRRQVISNVCAFKYRDPRTCTYSGAPVADIANRSFVDFYGMTLNNRGVYDSNETYNRGDYVSVATQFEGVSNVYVCAVDSTIGASPISNTSKWIADACTKNCAGCALRHEILRGSFFPGVARAPWLHRSS